MHYPTRFIISFDLEKVDIYFVTSKTVPQQLLQRRKPRPQLLRLQQQLQLGQHSQLHRILPLQLQIRQVMMSANKVVL